MEYRYTANFAAGPLGLGFAVMSDGTFRIEQVAGQAETNGVDAGDIIVSVAGIAISGMTKAEFVDTIKSQARPIGIVMSRKVEPAELQELLELDNAKEKHRA